MKHTIQFNAQNDEPQTLDVSVINTESQNILIKNLQKEGHILLNISHLKLNTILDFTEAKDFQVFFFMKIGFQGVAMLSIIKKVLYYNLKVKKFYSKSISKR